MNLEETLISLGYTKEDANWIRNDYSLLRTKEENTAKYPTFNKEWTDPVSAQEFAQELINHTYHNRWKLPKMP